MPISFTNAILSTLVNVQQRLAALDTRVDEQERSVKAITMDMRTEQSRVDAEVKARLKNVEGRMDDVEKRVEGRRMGCFGWVFGRMRRK